MDIVQIGRRVSGAAKLFIEKRIEVQTFFLMASLNWLNKLSSVALINNETNSLIDKWLALALATMKFVEIVLRYLWILGLFNIFQCQLISYKGVADPHSDTREQISGFNLIWNY